MRYYIATSLGNIKAAQQLRDHLNSMGWTQTYDWTLHGSMQARPEKWPAVAADEARGVITAQVVVCLMPGGRGTHVELGLALGACSHIAVVGTDPNAEYDCVFHHHPAVRRFASIDDLIPWLGSLDRPHHRAPFETEADFLRHRIGALQRHSNQQLEEIRKLRRQVEAAS